MVGDGRPGSVGPRDSGAASPAARGSRPSSVLSSGQLTGDAVYQTPSTPVKTTHVQMSSASTQTLSTVDLSINYESSPAPKSETLSYSVGIQTTESYSPPRQNHANHGFSDSEDDRSQSATHAPRTPKRYSRREREREEELRRNLRREIEEELKAVKSPTSRVPSEHVKHHKFPARERSADEMNAVTASEDFLEFVERSSKVIERALDQEYDVLADYALDSLNELDEDEDEGYVSSRGKKGRRMKEVAQFYDERWSKKRMISDINFSPKVSSNISISNLPTHVQKVS